METTVNNIFTKDVNFIEENVKTLFEKEPNCIKINDTLASMLFTREDSNYIIKFLKEMLLSQNIMSWQRALAMQCIGCCYYYNGDYENSKKYINDSVNVDTSSESLRKAYYFNNLFGFDDYYNDFTTKETEHFIFHIDPNVEGMLSKYNITLEYSLKRREEAYESINNFLSPNLFRKIDYYIWSSRDIAKEKQGRPLGFAHPEYYLIHSAYDQSIGHEMTHIMTHNIDGFTLASALISEGVAVYFDFTKQDKLSQAQKAMEYNAMKKINLKDLWLNWDSINQMSIKYPASAVLVKYLISEYGEDRFKLLLKNQTYENAKYIYGSKIDEILSKVEEILTVEK